MPFRSLLFVPANQRSKVEKARSANAGAVVLDLEDGVPRAEKSAARTALAGRRREEFLPALLVRLNAVEVGSLQEDVQVAIECGADGVVLPKVEAAAEIIELARHLPGTMGIIPSIETARGILRAEEIALSDKHVVGLTFGPEDFARDMAVERSRDGAERGLALGLLALAATSARTPLYDGPFGDFHDEAGLEADCMRGKAIGVKGRFAIHPSQLDTINRIFQPAQRELEWARQVVVAFEQAEAEGRGAVSVEGQMVDEPVYRRAKGIIEASAG